VARRLAIVGKEKVMTAAAEQTTSIQEIAFRDFFAKRSNGAEADNTLRHLRLACVKRRRDKMMTTTVTTQAVLVSTEKT